MRQYRVIKDRKGGNALKINGKIGFLDKKVSKEIRELFDSLPVMMVIEPGNISVVFQKPNFFIFGIDKMAAEFYSELAIEAKKEKEERLAKEKAEREKMAKIRARVEEIKYDPEFQIIPELKKVSTRYLGNQVKKMLEEKGIKQRHYMFDEFVWGDSIIKIPNDVIDGSYFREHTEFKISVFPDDLTQRINDLESKIEWGMSDDVLKLHNDKRSGSELLAAAGFTLHQVGKRRYWTGSVSVGESSDGYRAARTINQEVGIRDAVDKLYPGERAKLIEDAEKELETLKNQPPLKELVLSPIPEGYEVRPSHYWEDEIEKALLRGYIV